ncbi:uncharacterized protein LOC143187218 isoform X2 [Calliopsis andreniformis]|uniref:uncharacterized protein LOC143187218 isoform X2 n=1 Tax=Calliopsis andreniformis TaxID=337506 RepID=UPI003FCE37EE
MLLSSCQKKLYNSLNLNSPQMHPDSGSGKGDHADFVKINEAYTVLSKKSKRHEYDMHLNTYNSYSNSFQHHNYHEPRAYDFQRNDKSAPIKYTTTRIVLMCVALIIFGTCIQMLFAYKSLILNRQAMLKKSVLYQREYNEAKENAKHRTLEEQIKHIIELSKKDGFYSTDE